MKKLIFAALALAGCGTPITAPHNSTSPSSEPSATAAPVPSATPAPAPSASPAEASAVPPPLTKEEIQKVLAQPAWLDHLGGSVIDNGCPQKTMDTNKRRMPSVLSLTELDGEQSFMSPELTPKSWQLLYDYLAPPAGPPGHSFVYRQIPDGLFAGFQAFCILDDLKLAPADFTAAKDKNSVRIAAPSLAKLRALDPALELLVLTIDGTFVQTIHLNGLRKLKDPVITVAP
jgi:hypothetical protein